MKGDVNPRLCSAAESPLSVKVRVGDDADPVSSTTRVPVAVTLLSGFRMPLSFISPSLREIMAVAFRVGRT